MKKILLPILMLFTSDIVFAGGGISRPLVGVALGVATGGLSYAVTGATAAVAATQGAVAGIGYAATGHARVGVTTDGNLRNPTVRVETVGPRGAPIVADGAAMSNRPANPVPNDRSWAERLLQNGRSQEEIERERNEARSTFNIMTQTQYNFGITSHQGKKYHIAVSAFSSLLTTPDRGKWKIMPFRGYDSVTTFEPTSEIERLAMRSFNFEETPLLWHFSRENIDGRWYNRAYTDTNYDIMVPEGEVHNIAAPKWYTEERRQRQREAAELRAETERERQEQLGREARERAFRKMIRGYGAESRWATYLAVSRAADNDHAGSVAASQTAFDFARRAHRAFKEFANSAQRVVRGFAEELLIPGGIANERRHAAGLISDTEYLNNISTDWAIDLAAICVGAAEGAGEGLTLATATGGTMTVPAVATCAARGALTAYTVARAAKATGRVLISESRRAGSSSSSSSSEQGGQSYRAVKPGQEERIVSTPEDQRLFLERKLQNREWEKRRHRINGRRAYYEPETRRWYTKVIGEKNDFEVWTVSGKKATHLGAIEPKRGELYEGPKHPDARFD